GIVYDALQKRMNIYISIVLAGLLFGVYHMNIFQGTYATLIGIVMGFSLVWTKSIWAPIIIHFVNNLVSVLISYTVVGTWLDLEKALPIIVSITIAATLLPFGIYKLHANKVIVTPIEPTLDELIPEDSIEDLELDATV
ncbi:MAG: CPBP family intramembrane metalloprotease, partial [Firmicutes bacterium]|nr:CPBP family intramembrane metalloprotease [Bacillota bacterium]